MTYLLSSVCVFQVIKDYQLMGLVCVLAGTDMVVLTVWELVDPLRIRFLNKTLEQVVSEATVMLYHLCYTLTASNPIPQ